jgi:hypothetical protein
MAVALPGDMVIPQSHGNTYVTTISLHRVGGLEYKDFKLADEDRQATGTFLGTVTWDDWNLAVVLFRGEILISFPRQFKVVK